jgi:hypothetical protein
VRFRFRHYRSKTGNNYGVVLYDLKHQPTLDILFRDHVVVFFIQKDR